MVLSLHQQLDVAIAKAYGWPADLPDADLLTRLVQLNHQRQQEEAAGQVRYLRPAHQAPGQQAALTIPVAAIAAPVVASATTQPWPTELAQQMLAVRAIVQQAAGEGLSSAQVAARFRRTKPEKVKPLLHAGASAPHRAPEYLRRLTFTYFCRHAVPTPEPTFETPPEPLNEQELDTYRAQLVAFKAELDQYAADLNSHEKTRERTFEQRKSAEEEYDKLIVYLAGGGLVLTVGFVKDLTKAAETHQIGWLLGCWIAFAAALMVNLISHALARFSADAFLINHPRYKRYDGWVRVANFIALILVGGGVTTFLIFVYQNFPAHG